MLIHMKEVKHKIPKTIEVWHKVSTIEKPYWTELYHAKDPDKKSVWR